MPTKAVAAGASSGLAGAVTTLFLGLLWPTADANTAAALTTVFGAVFAFVGAYLPTHEAMK